MQNASANWVRQNACQTDLAGSQCIGATEAVTHHTATKGIYCNAPRPEVAAETDVSVIRGDVSTEEAMRQRNRKRTPAPEDVARGAVRRTTAGELRAAGFAVIHTPGKKRGHENPHVSVIWPDDNPLDLQERNWPADVQDAFAACFTEVEE